MQVERTFLMIAARQTQRCMQLAIQIVLLFACVAFLATAAEARPKKSVSKHSSVKKSAVTTKAKTKKSVRAEHSELPAAPPEFFKKNSTKPFSGISVNRRVADLQLKSELERYLGTRYKRGGTGGDGFDCSGFARSMYLKLFGVDLPHNAQSQFHLPMFAKLNAQALKTGDLVFFASTTKKKRISHVGIYLDDGQFIHAQSKRGVVISSMDEDYWRKRLVSAKRLEHTAGLSQGSFDQLSDWEDEQDEDELPETGMHMRYSTKQKRSLSVDRAVAKNSQQKQAQSVEVDYVRPVFGKFCNIHFGTFRDEFPLYGDDSEAALQVYDPLSAYSTYSYSQGIRIASDIQPFKWMIITPSFMHYNHGRELDSFEMPTSSLGIDVSLGSLNDAGWSLSTGLKYASLSTTAMRAASRSSDPSLLDMSLTYSQRLTDRLQLSLMGLRSSVTDMAADLRAGSRADQRVFFMMNYNY